VGFADAWIVLLQAHNAAVQDLTSQLSNGTSVNSRQKAELSTQEAQVQRLDGELSEQQGQVQQLQSLVSEKQFELQRLSAEKQSVIEDQQGMIGTLGDRLTSSQQEVSAAQQEKASAAHAHSAAAQVCSVLACCLAVVLTCNCTSQYSRLSLGTFVQICNHAAIMQLLCLTFNRVL